MRLTNSLRAINHPHICVSDLPRIYEIAIVCCQAPKSGGGKYRRPRSIRVFAPFYQDTAESRRGRGPALRALWRRSNVDSRYDGPRSEYGKAIREAVEIMQEANRHYREIEQQDVLTDLVRT